MKQEWQTHPFEPVWNQHSEILILGSFPSIRSREIGFYYGHPQNRFWPLLAALHGTAVPLSTEERKTFALDHHIALWDAVSACDITGSSDSSIHNAIPNDIASLVKNSRIQRIYCNGQTAGRIFQQYCQADCPLQAVTLPSTSAANAAWNMERLAQHWKVLIEG